MIPLGSAFIVDPAGANYLLQLTEYPELSDDGLEGELTANEALAVRGFHDRLDFTFQGVLASDEFFRFDSIIRSLDAELHNRTGQGDAVIYYAQEYAERGPARTRHIVPSGLTPNPHLLEQTDLGGGDFLWRYLIAQQGRIRLTSRINKGNHWEFEGIFLETLKLTAAMEV